MVSGQEVFQFTADLRPENVVPPTVGGGGVTGTGVFSLDGQTLTYEVRTVFLTEFFGGFYGPATPGENGPFIAPTTLRQCRFGPGGVPNFCLYQGITVVPIDQVQNLVDGLWYVQLTSRLFPDLALRGQVVQVPEPTQRGLFLIAIILWYGIHRWRQLSGTGHARPGTNAEPAGRANGHQALR